MERSEIRAQQRVLGEWLAEEASADPDRNFIQCGGDWVTLSELDTRSDELAAGLQRAGLAKGDRIALIIANGMEYVELIFAVAKIGAVQVPINTYLKGEFLRHQLVQTGVKTIIGDGPGLRVSAPLLAEVPTVELMILVGGDGDGVPSDATPLSEIRGAAADYQRPEMSPLDPCVIMHTSGTTGPSKGCTISHAYYTFIPQNFIDYGWFEAGDVIFGSGPLFHFTGQVMLMEMALAAGGSVVLEPEFSASTFMARAREVGATTIFGVGAMGMAVLGQPVDPEEKHHTVRQSTWIPMPEPIQKQFEERFGIPVISEIFGQSECWPVTMSHVDGPRKPASLGRALPGMEVLLVDDDGYEVPVGEVGEFVVRMDLPGMIYDGYWNNDAATASAFRNLWHHTGDKGRMDEDGFFYFVDRKKDAIRRRGENVSSIELEQAIMRSEHVAQAATHAVPSELTEDDIKACIVLAEGADPSIDELFDFFKTNLPYYAIPRYVEFIDALPASATGRIQKHVLRERGINAETIDLAAKGLTVARAERRS